MENFIEKIEQHPCLWNMSDMSYRDLRKKDSVWKQIARESGLTNGEEAKSQWKKLRDSHREALRRRKTSTGQPVQNLRPWKYESLMKFVLSQTKTRDYSNFSTASQDSHHEDQNTSDTNTNINVIEFPPLQPESPVHSSSSVESEDRKPNQLVTANFTKIFQDREKRREQRKTERDSLRRQTTDMNRTQQDALSNLFTSLCQKTRDLPKYLQIRVQREIFDAVTRAEEEAMSLDPMNC